MARKMIIKGVGTMMAKRLPTDPKGAIEVITLGTLQNLKIDMNVDIEDIFGGDGLFPIDTLVKNKSIDITATDTKFDLAALQLVMGSNLREGVSTGNDAYVHVLNEQVTAVTGTNGSASVGVLTPRFTDTIFTADPSFAVRLKDENKLLKQVTYAANTTLNADEFMVATTFDSGTYEVSTITVTAVPTYDGNITITLNGSAKTVGVETTDSITDVATKIATAINALTDYSASASSATVTITAGTKENQTDTAFDGGTTGVTATVNVTAQGAAPVSGGIKIYVASSLVNADFVMNYKRTETVDVVDILTDEVPFPVHIIHHGSFVQKDGSYGGIETELYACRAKGTFSIDAARTTASASSVSLSVIDPERTDGRLGIIKRYKANERV